MLVLRDSQGKKIIQSKNTENTNKIKDGEEEAIEDQAIQNVTCEITD